MRMMQVAFFLLFNPAFVYAGTMTCKWDPPTQYENGAPLAITDIEKYEIRYVGLNGAPRGNRYISPLTTKLVNGVRVVVPVTQTVITTDPGTYDVVIRTRLKKRNEDGTYIRSAWSTPTVRFTVK